MRHTTLTPSIALVVAIFGAACTNDLNDPSTADPSTAPAVALVKGGVSAEGPLTIAVIGDMPYGPVKLAEFPDLIAKINADPAVDLVFHAGDIKLGKNALCTDEYFGQIRGFFDRFADPLVYTPGDNEWTDCHASKGNGLYTPTERLQAVRAIFFPVAGRTLGQHVMNVASQASDPGNAFFIENVMFDRARVVYGDLNVPGSNDDRAAWGILPADSAASPTQAEEVATRDRANRAWLDRIFDRAIQTQAVAVVLLFQADMWDTAEPTLTGYDALVAQIGTRAAAFGKPVLLLEGDSHVFRVDHPFTPGDPLNTLHPTPAAPNVTRIVLEGSDAGRTEYLRLTVDHHGSAANLFSWERVPLH